VSNAVCLAQGVTSRSREAEVAVMKDRFDAWEATEASDMPRMERLDRLEAVYRPVADVLRWEGVGEDGGESISMA
jgi:hypothetical protein